jgi:ABC-type antimicrobial peptide transport system permease subunit
LGGLLSASGIFALASLNVEKRSKEIGIRKALGASVQNIIGLMNRDFVIILALAGILGSFGGYFITGALLDSIYSFHIIIGMIPVIVCATLIFIVGISTTSVTILQAARANPVDTLRNE